MKIKVVLTVIIYNKLLNLENEKGNAMLLKYLVRGAV